MKRVLAFLLLLAAPVVAQETRSANFTYLYDLDATAITYCRLEGANGDPFGGGRNGPANIQTTGSSATIDAVTAGTNPFVNVSAKDVIAVRDNAGATSLRVVISKASSDQIVVNSVITLASTPFQYYKTVCGTTAESGWIDVGNYVNRSIVFSIVQVAVTGGIDVRVECRDPGIGSPPVQIFPACTTGACATVQAYTGIAGITSTTKIVVPEPTSSCRVGILINSADDGGDLTTNTEQITITFAGRTR